MTQSLSCPSPKCYPACWEILRGAEALGDNAFMCDRKVDREKCDLAQSRPSRAAKYLEPEFIRVT